jgi:hypothetical protein
VTVYFGQFFENYKKVQNFGPLLSMVKFVNKFRLKWLGVLFRVFFSQTHLVTLIASFFSIQNAVGTYF